MKTLKNFPSMKAEELTIDSLIKKLKKDWKWKEDFEVDHEFLVAMDERVEEKQGEYGDGWKLCSINYLQQRVKQEYKEWLDSWREGEEVQKRKLVDLANLCRFLWERLGENV